MYPIDNKSVVKMVLRWRILRDYEVPQILRLVVKMWLNHDAMSRY